MPPKKAIKQTTQRRTARARVALAQKRRLPETRFLAKVGHTPDSRLYHLPKDIREMIGDYRDTQGAYGSQRAGYRYAYGPDAYVESLEMALRNARPSYWYPVTLSKIKKRIKSNAGIEQMLRDGEFIGHPQLQQLHIAHQRHQKRMLKRADIYQSAIKRAKKLNKFPKAWILPDSYERDAKNTTIRGALKRAVKDGEPVSMWDAHFKKNKKTRKATKKRK